MRHALMARAPRRFAPRCLLFVPPPALESVLETLEQTSRRVLLCFPAPKAEAAQAKPNSDDRDRAATRARSDPIYPYKLLYNLHARYKLARTCGRRNTLYTA